MYAVEVSEGDTLQLGKEELLFEGDFALGMRWGRQWDIHPDGEQFLIMQETANPDPPDGIRIVRNWFAELERLVPNGD
jgi:hypothetical protein